jgi:hypothetical protein
LRGRFKSPPVTAVTPAPISSSKKEWSDTTNASTTLSTVSALVAPRR